MCRKEAWFALSAFHGMLKRKERHTQTTNPMIWQDCGIIPQEGRSVSTERSKVESAIIMIRKQEGDNTMNKKEDICEYLKQFHCGKEKAVFSRELQYIFRIDGRNIRRNVAKLRKEGCPICSDENGYYYAETQTDINHTVGRLNDLVTSVSNARTGLLYANTDRPVEITIRMS